MRIREKLTRTDRAPNSRDVTARGSSLREFASHVRELSDELIFELKLAISGELRGLSEEDICELRAPVMAVFLAAVSSEREIDKKLLGRRKDSPEARARRKLLQVAERLAPKEAAIQEEWFEACAKYLGSDFNLEKAKELELIRVMSSTETTSPKIYSERVALQWTESKEAELGYLKAISILAKKAASVETAHRFRWRGKDVRLGVLAKHYYTLVAEKRTAALSFADKNGLIHDFSPCKIGPRRKDRPWVERQQKLMNRITKYIDTKGYLESCENKSRGKRR